MGIPMGSMEERADRLGNNDYCLGRSFFCMHFSALRRGAQ